MKEIKEDLQIVRQLLAVAMEDKKHLKEENEEMGNKLSGIPLQTMTS